VVYRRSRSVQGLERQLLSLQNFGQLDLVVEKRFGLGSEQLVLEGDLLAV
jgi:hypothetical protein